jgi:putative transposase
VPRVIVTDKLGSYVAAKREIPPGVEHRQKSLRRLAPTDLKARTPHEAVQSVQHAQQFLSIHTTIHNQFQLRSHRLSASEYRVARDRAFNSWRDAAGAALVG